MIWVKYKDERINLEDFTSFMALDNSIVFKTIEEGELRTIHAWEFETAEERDKILEQLDRKCEARKLDAGSTVGFQ